MKLLAQPLYPFSEHRIINTYKHMRLKLTVLSLFLFILSGVSSEVIEINGKALDWNEELSMIQSNISFAVNQTNRMLQTCNNNPSGGHPATGGKTSNVGRVGIYDWRSGFFSGNLWYLYELTGDNTFNSKAQTWTATLEPLKNYTSHHDLGFMMYCSFGNGYRLVPGETGNYKDILIKGAESLCTRYKEITKCIQSWPSKDSWHTPVTTWRFPVIMDNMMNLEMLMWASKATNDQTKSNYFKYVATTHANTTIKNHIRPDYSSFHVVDYNPTTGEVADRATNQGYSDNSTWSRGQAWGIYGFTMMYRETGDPEYLKTAIGMADFYLNHANLPEDLIPLWDFNVGEEGYDPDVRSGAYKNRTKYRDVSAGAVVASALFELYGFTTDNVYLTCAIQMLHSLTGSYRSNQTGFDNPNYILQHSVGSIPHNSEIDIPLIYADYYFLEALQRYRNYIRTQQLSPLLPNGIISSTEENPVWYYIENGHSSDASPGGGTYINDSDGRFCTLLTSSGTRTTAPAIEPLFPDNKRNGQRWRIQYMESSGAFDYYCLANQTNEYLSYDNFYTITTNPGSAVWFRVTKASTSDRYVQLQRKDHTSWLGSLNEGNKWGLADAGEVTVVNTITGLTGSPRAWRFVPVAEIDNNYPIIADDENNTTWYYIKNRGMEENNYLTINSSGNFSLSGKTGENNSGSQLFKLVESPLTDETTVYIINEATGNKKYLSFSSENLLTLSDTPKNWSLRHTYSPSNQAFHFNFRSTRAPSGSILSSDGIKMIVFNKASDAYNTPVAWSFEKYTGPGSGIYIPKEETVRIYAERGRIYVEGTDAPVRIYSITGAVVNIQNQLPHGIYIVKAGNYKKKVLIH